LRTFSGPGRALNVMAAPRDKMVFVGRDDKGNGDVQMFKDSGVLVRTFRGHEHGVSAIWVTPDGKWLLTSSWDGTAAVWEVSTGKRTLTYRGHKGLVQGIVCG